MSSFSFLSLSSFAALFLVYPAFLSAPASKGSASTDAGFCSVLDEEFSGSVINPKTWKHEITMSGGGNWEFEWYCGNESLQF